MSEDWKTRHADHLLSLAALQNRTPMEMEEVDRLADRTFSDVHLMSLCRADKAFRAEAFTLFFNMFGLDRMRNWAEMGFTVIDERPGIEQVDQYYKLAEDFEAIARSFRKDADDCRAEAERFGRVGERR